MIWLKGKFRRAGAALCVVLMGVFALAVSANAVNRIQHASGAMLPHTHTLFSEMLLEDHHDSDHHHEAVAASHHHDDAADHHDDLNADQEEVVPSSNGAQPHHHGDTGASLVILGSPPPTLVTLAEQRQDMAFVRFTVSVQHALPERPPRMSDIAI